MMDTKKVFVSLGSNLGDKESYIRSALEHIASLKNTEIVLRSSLMRTSPVVVRSQTVEQTEIQDDYLDQLILINTSLQPLELLREFKRLEKLMGRKQRPRWSEREIDIDVIIYEGVNINTDELTVPHPEFTNRLFVLKGCAELDPDYVVDGLGRTTKELYFNNIDRLREQRVEAY
jgi:2-amino-4-hydroxy-6-hydroxymethyldihydropteridine diphosphokinase